LKVGLKGATGCHPVNGTVFFGSIGPIPGYDVVFFQATIYMPGNGAGFGFSRGCPPGKETLSQGRTTGWIRAIVHIQVRIG
ncbi:MAG: hypothetical protein QNK37_23025, partial [Acidobacteriota bacterium]|nr:hypothetical protein [Acidobacteriota bacterium]